MNLRYDFAYALTSAMKRYPGMQDYLDAMKGLAKGYGAKRDGSGDWVLPDGSRVTIEDLQAAYRDQGLPVPEEDWLT